MPGPSNPCLARPCARLFTALRPFSLSPVRPCFSLCLDRSIIVNGYSPFGGAGQAGKLLSDPRLKKIATAHNTGTAQVVLAWQWFGHKVVVNPEATNPEYQKENMDFFGIGPLTVSEMAIQ